MFTGPAWGCWSHSGQSVHNQAGYQWKNQRVELSSECYVFFKGEQLTHRYFNQNGIHLSCSGTKRLLDAINRKCHIVADFNTCAFNRGQTKNSRVRGTEDFHSHIRNGQYRNFNRQYNQSKIRCIVCNLLGHKIADCYYTTGVDFTKGFKTCHKCSTEIRFMLMPMIVLFIAHEFITGNFWHNR